MNKPLIIYHKGCPDGMWAAWVAWKHFNGEIDLWPASYGEKSPNVIDKEVYILDFSYPREELCKIINDSNSLTLLDHHASAEKELVDLSNDSLEIVFNMEKCGAILTWEYFHPTEPVPELILYCDDRDRWQWKLPSSREINAALSNYKIDIEVYDKLSSKTFSELYDEGVVTLRYQNKEIDELISKASVGWFGTHYVPIVNNSVLSLSSETGNRLAKNQSFSVVWFQKPNGDFYYSLRSIMGEGLYGIDVSEVAKSFGGGGHKQAAGVTSKFPLHKYCDSALTQVL